MRRKSNTRILFAGTYTKDSTSKGIYSLSFDPQSGSLEISGVTEGVTNPSFVALHPSKRYLFSVSETGSEEASGAVSSFKIDEHKGALKPVNTVTSRGSGPCHLAVSPSGSHVYVANYSSGSVAALPVSDKGALGEPTFFAQHEGSGPDPTRQTAPHAHSVTVDPSGTFVFACDLGLDRIIPYRIVPEAGMAPGEKQLVARVEPGAGPRHMGFHPSGKFAYVVNEMGCTVSAFRYAVKTGELTTFQTISTLPVGFTGENTCADIHLSPDGARLYASNRGHDSVAVFSIDPSSGGLALEGHVGTGGRTPRNFALSPDGSWLIAANQDSDSVVVYTLAGTNGIPRETGVTLEVPKPVCVQFYG